MIHRAGKVSDELAGLQRLSYEVAHPSSGSARIQNIVFEFGCDVSAEGTKSPPRRGNGLRAVITLLEKPMKIHAAKTMVRLGRCFEEVT